MRTRSGSPGRPASASRAWSRRSIRLARSRDETVGVISVDPSSPFTQGALLGDRIRLTDHFLDPDVFIRSMGTRGHLGGLAETTLQALLVLDAAQQGRRLPRDGRHGAERGRRALDRRHRRARADARLRRLDPGAEGGDHGDPRRDRDQQDGPPAGEDDAERGAPGARARPEARAGGRRSCSPRRCAARASTRSGRRSREHRAWLEAKASSSAGGARNLAQEVFAGRLGAGAPASGGRRCSDDAELRRLLDDVQERRLDPLTAVREILEKVFRIGDARHDRRSLTSRRRASASSATRAPRRSTAPSRCRAAAAAACG